MVEFRREKTHPACIWNAQKKRPIKFTDDVCITEDEFEIEALTKAGYIEVKEAKKKKKATPKVRKIKPIKKGK